MVGCLLPLQTILPTSSMCCLPCVHLSRVTCGSPRISSPPRVPFHTGSTPCGREIAIFPSKVSIIPPLASNGVGSSPSSGGVPFSCYERGVDLSQLSGCARDRMGSQQRMGETANRDMERVWTPPLLSRSVHALRKNKSMSEGKMKLMVRNRTMRRPTATHTKPWRGTNTT